MKQSGNMSIRKIIIYVLLLFCISIQASGQNKPVENLPQFLFPHFDTAVIIMKTGTRVNAVMNYNTALQLRFKRQSREIFVEKLHNMKFKLQRSEI